LRQNDDDAILTLSFIGRSESRGCLHRWLVGHDRLGEGAVAGAGLVRAGGRRGSPLPRPSLLGIGVGVLVGLEPTITVGD